MVHWNLIKDVIEVALQVATIIVLGITWRAVRRQASAAEELTTATRQQIKTGQEQAAAAREQVEVARRQITESLRPILICTLHAPVRVIGGGGDSVQDIEVQNNGAGIALDVWWSYGKPGDPPTVVSRRRVQSGIIPPTRGGMFRASEARAVHERIMIVYESLAGVVSASTLQWDGNYWVPDYIPDVTEWAQTLLGKPLGPS
jgi:hypothetical protein